MADEIVALVLDDVGQALLTDDSQFADSVNFQKIITAFATVEQDNEDTLIEILRQRDVDDAEGVQLDFWGRVVGELRRDHSDVSYRKFIKARIIINDSEGNPERLIEILKLLADDAGIVLREYPFATVELTYLADVLDSDAGLFPEYLDTAAAGGVRVWPIIEAPLDCFFLDSLHAGFATTTITTIEGANHVDTELLTITDGSPGNPAKVFEFDDNASVSGSNVLVDITGLPSGNVMRDRLITAINGETGASFLVTASDGGDATVILTKTVLGDNGTVSETVANAGFIVSDFVVPSVAEAGELDDINNAGAFSDLCKIVTSDLQFSGASYSVEYSTEFGNG